LVASDARGEGWRLVERLQQLPDLRRRRGLRLNATLSRALLAEKNLPFLAPDHGRDGEDSLAFFAVLAEH
jgi:hypothetical protein